MAGPHTRELCKRRKWLVEVDERVERTEKKKLTDGGEKGRKLYQEKRALSNVKITASRRSFSLGLVYEIYNKLRGGVTGKGPPQHPKRE